MKTGSACPEQVTDRRNAGELRREAENRKIETIIVAVHGIGNQYRYATIQSVAHRVASYYGPPVGIPLGNFHGKKGEVRALPFKGQDKLGLAEVYWADIPRVANKEKDTIEETKAWAKTMVERVRALDQQAQDREKARRDALPAPERSGWLPGFLRPKKLQAAETSVDYEKTGAVVEGMIDFIGTVENLCFLAEKAGLMTFDLRELLDEYLGDVQIVAEFEDYRGEILERFRSTMSELCARHTAVQHIHIVAHSEGTVVAFRGLLEALSAEAGAGYEWVAKVKSLTTLGSPIDKHMVLWPDLWADFKQAPSGWRNAQPIRWWNYYDLGDPVGFELDTTREWLIHWQWIAPDATKLNANGSRVPAAAMKQDFFDFPHSQEVQFTRYPFPGKAHNDYWEDAELFDHVLAKVMKVDRATSEPPHREETNVPQTKPFAKIVSWVLPYVLAFLLLLFGTYLVYKNVGDATHWPESTGELAKSVFGLTCLLAGVTLVSRVPRLVPIGWWYLLPAGVFSAGAGLYARLVSETTRDRLDTALEPFARWGSTATMIGICLAVGVCRRLPPRRRGLLIWVALAQSPGRRPGRRKQRKKQRRKRRRRPGRRFGQSSFVCSAFCTSGGSRPSSSI